MDKFEYTYSAPTEEEKKEIKYIRNQYKPKDEKSLKLERLRSLDNKVKNIPTCVSLAFGTIGLLIFGLGLTMVLQWNLVVWGIIVGIVGLPPMAIAYFVYLKLYTKLKNQYSEEILKLSSELLNEDE